MLFTRLFVDLDNTLYPSNNGLWLAIRERMNHYIQDLLSLPQDEISELRHTYYETYGTTLRGLQVHHDIDAEDFLAYVHDLPIEELVQPDPELRDMFFSLPQPKYVFTNSNIEHAQRVLVALRLEECFEDIIDIRAINFKCKPNPQAYQIALRLAGENYPKNCIFMDDSIRNLTPAFKMGFYTILVGTNSTHRVVYQSLKRPHDLRKAMPELWSE